MSIYVGGEKAKFYKGDYGPAQFYKGDVKIAGYTDGEKVGAQISGVETYNDALLPTIEGKSEQTVTVLGKNLFDPMRFVSEINATIPSAAMVKDWQGVPCVSYPCAVGSLRFMHHQFKVNTPYTISGEVGFDLTQERQIEFMTLIYTDGTQRAIYVANVMSAVFRTFRFTTDANKTVDYISVNAYSSYYIANIKIASLQLEEGLAATPYEPFVPNSPSPDYPSPIRSSENFDVVSCGRNLLDVYAWGNYGGVVPIDNVITQTFTTGALFLNIIRTPMKLKPNQTYSIVVSVLKSDSTDINGYTGLWGYDNGFDDGGRFIGATRIIANSVSVRKFTPSPDGNFALGIGGGGGTPYTLSLQVMILEGTYTAETLPPYEPYHATTAHVTDPLRSVGDVADSIEVSEGKVEVVRRVENRKLTASDIEIFNPDSYKNVTYFQISKTSDDINRGDYKNAVPLLCEFAQFTDYRPSGFDSATQVDKICTGGNNFYLVGFTHGTTEAHGKEKLANTNYLYALKTPTRTDITTTPLGQALLALRTQPHYTQVYTNATLPPTLRARIKEMEL